MNHLTESMRTPLPDPHNSRPIDFGRVRLSSDDRQEFSRIEVRDAVRAALDQYESFDQSPLKKELFMALVFSSLDGIV